MKKFKKTVWDFYNSHGRKLPWRNTTNPYRIVVSEIMLQQTQVDRVVPKYKAFIKQFPNFKALALASKRDVLQYWQGLGYNRRALALKRIAETITVKKFKIKDFQDPQKSVTLPGIGPATAASIAAFAFNKPTLFIETNIRRVFIHHFFENKKNVSDDEIIPLIKKTLDQKNPREWYAALMDYGSMLGKTVSNPNRKSKHYTKQSRFEGSRRQIRGKVVNILATSENLSESKLVRTLNENPIRLKEILDDLEREGLVTRKGKSIMIS